MIDGMRTVPVVSLLAAAALATSCTNETLPTATPEETPVSSTPPEAPKEPETTVVPHDPAADRRLLRAAEEGDVAGVEQALDTGARIEARDGNRRTALLLAATFDRVEVARLLVARGADPDALDDRHDTPWLVTGVTGSVPMLEALLPADPDLTIRNRYGGISVIPASERGHVAYVRRVVETGIDVNHVNDLGWTALLEAVILGDGTPPYQRIVRILLDAGADQEIPDGDGVTALQHAESKGQAEVARILRESPGRPRG